MASLLMLAGAAMAEPVWRVYPSAVTHVQPGKTLDFVIAAVNTGDTDADGSETLTVSLPDGLVGVSYAGTTLGAGGSWTCSDPSGAQVITCAPPGPIHPARGRGAIPFRITTQVGADVGGDLRVAFEITGGGASRPGRVADVIAVVPTLPGFGIDAFDVASTNAVGDPFTQAGGTPDFVTTTVELNSSAHPTYGAPWPAEPLKDIEVDLPAGLIGNPTMAAECTVVRLLDLNCASASQVGVATVLAGRAGSPFSFLRGRPVYNMATPPNVPARFGMNIFGTLVMLDGEVRSGGDYGVTVKVRNASTGVAILASEFTFWGVPADPSHAEERVCPGEQSAGDSGVLCTNEAQRRPFLRLPTSCTPAGVGLPVSLRADSWFDIGDFKSKSIITHLPPGLPDEPDPALWGPHEGITSCDNVPFLPAFAATPNLSVRSNSPAAFSFDLTIPQSDDPDAVAQSDLRRAVVTLPEGVRVSPSSAHGLAGCAPEQIRLADASSPSCPEASKVGTVRVDTPLLEEPLEGAVYLATPHSNPSGSLLALYIAGEARGVVVKLDGRVEPDPVTGQLRAIFEDNPQLPFSKLHLEFEGGPLAALVAPPQCGTFETRAVLTGWNGKTVNSTSTFTVSRGAGGGPCKALGFTPELTAGVANPIAGEHSRFSLRLTRDDEDEEIGAMTVTMPRGLLARVRGVPLCPEAQARTGSCSEASRVGDVTVGAGAGSNPLYIRGGRAYLGGPYKGAPFNLSIVVPAVAGPFDLGNVVVRAAVHLDRRTAELRVVSDPLPTVLEGIRLQVRDVRVNVDRSRFIINPTSCKEKEVRATVGSTAGTRASLSSRFQVADCGALPLKPRLRLTVGAKGRTAIRRSTPLVAKLTQTPGQTNLKSVGVTLPLSLNALLNVVQDACTQAEFDAGNCEKARTGSAVAVTPLLDKPLRGAAYFVKNPTVKGGLPNLIVALRGQVDFDLVGTIEIPGGTRLATNFASVPDVPITSFTLRMSAGKDGAVGVAENLCSKRAQRRRAQIVFEGQNGDVVRASQRLNIRGCGKGGR